LIQGQNQKPAAAQEKIGIFATKGILCHMRFAKYEFLLNFSFSGLVFIDIARLAVYNYS
jgi:hypothetical protein